MKNNNGSVLGFILFTFGKIAIASSGMSLLITTYTSTEPLNIAIIILYTIIGIYVILHGISNAGSLKKYKRTLWK